MSSSAEAELGALFINAKSAIAMHHTLKELGHHQPRTSVQTDNKMANDLLTNKIMPKALKAMDMRFHCLWCQRTQGWFRYYWQPGTQTLADYFTKHHPASHHIAQIPTYLTQRKDPQYKKLFLMSPTMKPNKKMPTKSLTTTSSFARKLLSTKRFSLAAWSA